MNEIRLSSLILENFKGQDYLTFNFDGHSASIFGDNATGKTTIYDALTWLLFGKDSHGQSSFDIKPLALDGNVRDHAAITSVEAVFDTSEGPRTLKKTFLEKWSAKRGQAEKSFDGNTCEYYSDGVPCKKYEFERQVAEMVDETAFRLLTSVTYFCADMSWQERRKVLFDVCGIATDADIMAGAPQFAPLASAMGRLSLDDYKKKLTAERRGLSGTRDSIPDRLDEHKKAIRDLESIDFATLQTEHDRRAVKREALQAELLSLEHNALLDSKINERTALKNRLAKLENDNTAYRNSQVVHAVDERPAIQREIDGLRRRFVRSTDEKEAADRDISLHEGKVQECRDTWIKVNSTEFSGAVCPTCGQALVGQKLEDAKAIFEKDKLRQLSKAVQDSDFYKSQVASARDRREKSIQYAVELENEIAVLTDKLSKVKPASQPEIHDIPDYLSTAATLAQEIDAISAVIASLTMESSTIKTDTKAAISTLTDEIRVIDGELAKKSMLEYTRERMKALQGEAQTAAEKLEKLDQMLFLCDDFTRYKVQFVEDSINSRFRLVKFRLFMEQINGGLADCCDATVDGVPYASLNNGARINVGMDAIATLSEHYGIRVPLFVDNAESVTELLPVDTQLIRLVVSENDKKLRCDYGA